MSQLSRCKLTRVRKTVEETVWRDVLTAICRSEDLTGPPLVGCCRWNLMDVVPSEARSGIPSDLLYADDLVLMVMVDRSVGNIILVSDPVGKQCWQTLLCAQYVKVDSQAA